jgi:hypothetical protein
MNADLALASRFVKHTGTCVVRDLDRARIKPMRGDFRAAARARRRFPVVGIGDEDVACAQNCLRAGFNRNLCREVRRRSATACEDNDVISTIRRLAVTQNGILAPCGSTGDEVEEQQDSTTQSKCEGHFFPLRDVRWTSNDLAFSCERT